MQRSAPEPGTEEGGAAAVLVAAAEGASAPFDHAQGWPAAVAEGQRKAAIVGRVAPLRATARLVGAPPGVYQPRFWDMKLLETRYLEGGRQAHTRLSLECTDLRPGARGGGKFLPLELDWVKQGGNWFLEGPARTR